MQRLLFIFRISCYKYPVFQDYWASHHAAHHPRAEREEQCKAASERRKPALAVAHPPGGWRIFARKLLISRVKNLPVARLWAQNPQILGTEALK
jgi:hypothetical protein